MPEAIQVVYNDKRAFVLGNTLAIVLFMLAIPFTAEEEWTALRNAEFIIELSVIILAMVQLAYAFFGPTSLHQVHIQPNSFVVWRERNWTLNSRYFHEHTTALIAVKYEIVPRDQKIHLEDEFIKYEVVSPERYVQNCGYLVDIVADMINTDIRKAEQYFGISVLTHYKSGKILK